MSRKPQRIVSLLPSSTEILCALGLETEVVGVTHECDFPPEAANKPHITSSRISQEIMTSNEIDHAVRSQLDGHGSIYDLNEKLLQKLDPDLIFTQELCDVCAVNYEMVAKAARVYAEGAKVVSLEPTTIEEIFDNVETVGELCGVPERAADAVIELRNRLERIRKKVEKADSRPRVFMLEWLDPPFAPGHWVPEQVEIAGGECILGEAGSKSVATTFERICESNPEIVVLIPCGYYVDDILKQLKRTDFPQSFRNLEAVKSGNVWALDAAAYFSRPGPRVVDGAEVLAKVVHPELFGDPQNSEAVRIRFDAFLAGAAGYA